MITESSRESRHIVVSVTEFHSPNFCKDLTDFGTKQCKSAPQCLTSASRPFYFTHPFQCTKCIYIFIKTVSFITLRRYHLSTNTKLLLTVAVFLELESVRISASGSAVRCPRRRCSSSLPSAAKHLHPFPLITFSILRAAHNQIFIACVFSVCFRKSPPFDVT